MTTATLQIITSRDELESFVADHADDIANGELFVRWSHGPDADDANDWTSFDWSDPDNPVELDGLSATTVYDADDAINAIRRWRGQVWGETCYILTGWTRQQCSDDEPLVLTPEPLAIVDRAVIAR